MFVYISPGKVFLKHHVTKSQLFLLFRALSLCWGKGGDVQEGQEGACLHRGSQQLHRVGLA